MREVIKTGRTVEDATELALAELGVSAEAAAIEVLELPQRRPVSYTHLAVPPDFPSRGSGGRGRTQRP